MQIRDLPFADPGTPDVRSGQRLLLWLGRTQLGGQAKALCWGLLHLGSIAATPALTGFAVQAVVERDGQRLAVAGVLLALLAVTVSVGDTMEHRTAITNWITAAARVQQLLSRKTAELGSTLTRQVAAGEVVAVSTGDIEKIGWCVEATSRFGSALLTVFGVCAGLVVYEPRLGLLVSAGVLLLAAVVLPLLPRATRRADDQRDKAGRATELAADTVAGLRVLRGIGGEELFLGRYRRASQEVRRAAVRTARMWALIAAVQVALPGLLLLGVVWYGARLTLDGRTGVGELVTVYGAVTFLLLPLKLFSEFAMAYSFSRPSARRAARVLSLSRGGHSASGSPRVPLSYEAVPALSGELYDPVTGVRAHTGQLTAVVCGDPDAAGLLADRLGGHPPGGHPEGSHSEDGHPEGAETSVRLGGVPLDGVPLEAARTAVLVHDKDPVLLSGTLRELLDVPSGGTVGAVRALEAAQCADVLEALTRGDPGADGDPMAARITERGRSLSGGQRQRLALARSLAADPEVLVLDEPTAAVDTHTEARIAHALRGLRTDRTTVVLTSSPLLLDRADRVLFVRDGRVRGEGRHRELLHDDPGYRAVVTREPEPREADAWEPDARERRVQPDLQEDDPRAQHPFAARGADGRGAESA
ncbi:ABC transporter ATP-binding protein [Streptomyces sp. ODS28]|uniref:ABC transporter ATP-binding protein n=1 Tax=Streptomyces sp. ODS28 TaxID=3136688 RepID=UPI0031EA60EE